MDDICLYLFSTSKIEFQRPFLALPSIPHENERDHDDEKEDYTKDDGEDVLLLVWSGVLQAYRKAPYAALRYGPIIPIIGDDLPVICYIVVQSLRGIGCAIGDALVLLVSN